MVQPPGQLEMFPPPAVKAAPPWLVVDAHGHELGPVRNLTMAASIAAQIAGEDGDAWLIAGDGSACHVDRAGGVTPTSGWPSAVARVIQRIRSTHTRKATPDDQDS